MTALVNIGLITSADTGKRPVCVMQALAVLAPFGIVETAVHASDTEPTLVALVREAPNAVGLEYMSAALQQDCVASFDFIDGEGLLAGPKADAWGPFNPAYFLTLSGDRMAQAAAA